MISHCKGSATAFQLTTQYKHAGETTLPSLQCSGADQFSHLTPTMPKLRWERPNPNPTETAERTSEVCNETNWHWPKNVSCWYETNGFIVRALYFNYLLHMEIILFQIMKTFVLILPCLAVWGSHHPWAQVSTRSQKGNMALLLQPRGLGNPHPGRFFPP